MSQALKNRHKPPTAAAQSISVKVETADSKKTHAKTARVKFENPDDDDDLPAPDRIVMLNKAPATEQKPAGFKSPESDSDLDSDSDSEVTRQKHKRQKVTIKKNTPHIPITRKTNNQLLAPVDVSKFIPVSDILTQGVLNSDLLADIEKYYPPGNQHWQNKIIVNLPLYIKDDEEEQRRSNIAQGVFHDPRIFTLIRHMSEHAPVHKQSLQELQNNTVNLYNIEPIPRWWDDKMLWDPDPAEKDRSCSNGQACLCYEWFGFVLRAFYTPLEMKAGKNLASDEVPQPPILNGRPLNNNRREPVDVTSHMCLLCQRKTMAFLKTSMKVSGTRTPENYVNQRWRNMVNCVGEYVLTDSLTLDNGMIYPVIMNHKAGYTMHSDRNRKWLTQSGHSSTKKTRRRKIIPRRATGVNASTKLDPTISCFFSASHSISNDLEECLLNVKNTLKEREGNGTLPPAKSDSEIEERIVEYVVSELPFDQWHIKYGHPTLALVHYFKQKGAGLIYPSHACFDSIMQINAFVTALVTVLLLPVVSCVTLVDLLPVSLSENNKWVCPCGGALDCGIYCRALKARLEILQMALFVADHNNHAMIINHVYAHIDAHMPLLCAVKSYDTYLEEQHAVSGKQTRRKYACSTDIMLGLIEHAPVSVMWAYTEDCIPDTSKLVLLSIYYNDRTNTSSNKRVLQSKFPHLNDANITRIQNLVNLLYKGLPNRCNNRELWKFIRRCCVDSKIKQKYKTSMASNQYGVTHAVADLDMVEFFFKLIIASVLGVYKSSTNKMENIMSRQSIYSMFYNPVPFVQIKGIMIPQNKITLLYIMKEYIRCMAERSPGVLEGLKQVYEWKAYDTYITNITRDIRTVIFHNMTNRAAEIVKLADIFHNCDVRVSSVHSESRRSQHQNDVNYDTSLIHKELKDMNLKDYNENPDQDVSFIGIEYRRKSPHPVISDLQLDVMTTIVSRFSPDQYIPIVWLVCFGVSPVHILVLHRALFGKMTVLMKYMMMIKKTDPYGYAVLWNFFRVVKAHNEHREYTADAFMYLQHARALNNYHDIGINQPIPRVIGKVHVCPNCNDFKRPSFFRPLKRNKNGGGIGIVRICLDGQIVCGRKVKTGKTSKANKKIKLSSSVDEDDEDDDDDAEDSGDDGDVDEDDEDDGADDKPDVLFDEDLRDEDASKINIAPRVKTKKRDYAKYVAMQHMLNRCQYTKTISIDTLGKVTEYQGRIYIGCMKCIRTIPLSAALDMGELKVCNSCFSGEVDKPKERTKLELAEQNGKVYADCSKCARSVLVLSMFQMGDQIVCNQCFKPKEKAKCEAIGCNKKIITAADFRTVTVYDDVNTFPVGASRFRDMVLCVYHGSGKWLHENDSYYNMSHVLSRISDMKNQQKKRNE